MKTFVIATALVVSMTTDANALHINGCDPKNIECICHLKKYLSSNSMELLDNLYMNVSCERNDNDRFNNIRPDTDNNGSNTFDNSDDSNGDRSVDHSSNSNSDDSNGDHSDYENG